MSSPIAPNTSGGNPAAPVKKDETKKDPKLTPEQQDKMKDLQKKIGKATCLACGRG